MSGENPLNMKSEINEENIRNLKRAVTVKLLNEIQTEYAETWFNTDIYNKGKVKKDNGLRS